MVNFGGCKGQIDRPCLSFKKTPIFFLKSTPETAAGKYICAPIFRQGKMLKYNNATSGCCTKQIKSKTPSVLRDVSQSLR